MLRRLYPYWRSSTRAIALGGLLLVISAGFELLQPWPVKWLVDSVFLKHPGPAWYELAGTA